MKSQAREPPPLDSGDMLFLADMARTGILLGQVSPMAPQQTNLIEACGVLNAKKCFLQGKRVLHTFRLCQH